MIIIIAIVSNQVLYISYIPCYANLVYCNRLHQKKSRHGCKVLVLIGTYPKYFYKNGHCCYIAIVSQNATIGTKEKVVSKENNICSSFASLFSHAATNGANNLYLR